MNKKKRLNSLKSLIDLLGGETTNHVNFKQPILVPYRSSYYSPLEGDIRKVSNY